jgi:ferric-dicitrate binding protein FerR (iron transport regulator)
MSTERIYLLLSLQLSGEATPAELAELNSLLAEHPEISAQAEWIRNAWKGKSIPSDETQTASYNKHLQRLSNHLSAPVLQYEEAPVADTMEEELPPSSEKRKHYWWLSAAAVAASVLIVVSFFALKPGKSSARSSLAKNNTVSTLPWTKSKLKLPDGSTVWLNAGSRLTYDEQFDAPLREVQLTGEAYFDVVKDKTRPFIIHTGTIDVKVLGTAFNVRSYPNEKTTETALIRGRVEITLHNNPDKKIILRPNEKLIVNNDIASTETTTTESARPKEETMMTLSKIRMATKDSVVTETKWTQDTLEFDGEPFQHIVDELERQYHVHFVLKNKALKKMRFTGVFENKSLLVIMEALHVSGRFQYEYTDDIITVW